MGDSSSSRVEVSIFRAFNKDRRDSHWVGCIGKALGYMYYLMVVCTFDEHKSAYEKGTLQSSIMNYEDCRSILLH